ncbi:MAG: AAA family ATPase [Magnetococcales bacterium]|nr:AAA family ATPase [Magnetococcales bacterium]
MNSPSGPNGLSDRVPHPTGTGGGHGPEGRAVHREAYLDFLGLSRNPFPVSPDSDHFFMPARIDALIGEIQHAILTRKGFMVITGEVGLGKTTISQRLLRLLEADGVETALVFNTFLQGSDLLDEIIRDFGIPAVAGGLPARMESLNRFLMERYAAGGNCAILIDDSQNLSAESLELIRMISNLETNAEKLVQILLIGQPELLVKLDAHELRQLKSRVVIHAQVSAYDLEELKQYVFFKLNAVGSRGNVVIGDRSFRLIHALTQGNPRRVNNLMDRSLYGLFAYNTNRVTNRLLLEVAKEIGFGRPRRAVPKWLLPAGLAAGGLATVGVMVWLGLRMAPGSLSAGRPAATTAEVARAERDKAAAEAQAARAAEVLERTRAELAQAQGERESARAEIAKAKVAQELAQAEVAKAQLREARALARVAQQTPGADVAQASQQQAALDEARKAREQAEARRLESAAFLDKALADAKRSEESLTQALTARKRAEDEAAHSQQELGRIKAALQEQAVALAKALDERAQAEQAAREARERMVSAQAEAEAKAEEAKVQAQRAAARDKELAAARQAREQAEQEATLARGEAQAAMTRLDKGAQEASLEFARRESELLRQHQESLEAARKAREDAEARAKAAREEADQQVTATREQEQKSRQELEERHARELTEAENARQRAQEETAQAQALLARIQAEAEASRRKVEGLKDQARTQGETWSGAVAEENSQALRQALEERTGAETKAREAQDALQKLQERNREAQQRVTSLEARLRQLSRGGSAVEIAKDVQDFLAHYRLEGYGALFQEALETASLELAAHRIAQESGWRLVRLPAGLRQAAQDQHVLTVGGADGLFFWKPPFWMEFFYFGQQDPEAEKLQKALASWGYYDYKIDGVVGRVTMQALTGFQRIIGLPLTGRPDAETLFMLTRPPPSRRAEAAQPVPTVAPVAQEDAQPWGGQWVIQLGSYAPQADLDALAGRLRSLGFPVLVQLVQPVNSGRVWKALRIGPLDSRQEAEVQLGKLPPDLTQSGIILKYTVPSPEGDNAVPARTDEPGTDEG